LSAEESHLQACEYSPVGCENEHRGCVSRVERRSAPFILHLLCCLSLSLVDSHLPLSLCQLPRRPLERLSVRPGCVPSCRMLGDSAKKRDGLSPLIVPFQRCALSKRLWRDSCLSRGRRPLFLMPRRRGLASRLSRVSASGDAADEPLGPSPTSGHHSTAIGLCWSCSHDP
jgi:hypothetical protein